MLVECDTLQKNIDIWSDKVFRLEIPDVYHMVVDETHNPCEFWFTGNKMAIKLMFHNTLKIILYFVTFRVFRLKEFPSITKNHYICFQLPSTVNL